MFESLPNYDNWKTEPDAREDWATCENCGAEFDLDHEGDIIDSPDGDPMTICASCAKNA